MTYLFDSMFLQSRLQLSSLFKLIPKPPCSGEEKPACSGECQGVCDLEGLIYLPTLGSCTPKFWVSPLLGCSSSVPVQGRCLLAEGSAKTQGLGDLSCMGKSNHAAPALGYYFSTRGCVRISSCRGQSWNCHSKHFTWLHGINRMITALGDFHGNACLGLRVHSLQNTCSRYL